MLWPGCSKRIPQLHQIRLVALSGYAQSTDADGSERGKFRSLSAQTSGCGAAAVGAAKPLVGFGAHGTSLSRSAANQRLTRSFIHQLDWSHGIEVLPFAVLPHTFGVLDINGALLTQYLYGHIFCAVAEDAHGDEDTCGPPRTGLWFFDRFSVLADFRAPSLASVPASEPVYAPTPITPSRIATLSAGYRHRCGQPRGATGNRTRDAARPSGAGIRVGVLITADGKLRVLTRRIDEECARICRGESPPPPDGALLSPLARRFRIVPLRWSPSCSVP